MERNQKKQCSIVVAYDRRRGIGIDNKLPWGRSLPADLQHFRQLTTGGTVIMGRKLTHSKLDGIATASSLENALQMASKDTIYIIGGATVYAAALKSNVVSKIYATEVDAELPADTFFPELNDTWRKTSEESHATDDTNTYPYIFAIYEK